MRGSELGKNDLDTWLFGPMHGRGRLLGKLRRFWKSEARDLPCVPSHVATFPRQVCNVGPALVLPQCCPPLTTGPPRHGSVVPVA